MAGFLMKAVGGAMSRIEAAVEEYQEARDRDADTEGNYRLVAMSRIVAGLFLFLTLIEFLTLRCCSFDFSERR